MPGRRYGEFADLLRDFHNSTCAAQEEVIGETSWQGLRLLMAHNPAVAAELTAARDNQIKDLELKAQGWAGKLAGQDAGIPIGTASGIPVVTQSNPRRRPYTDRGN